MKNKKDEIIKTKNLNKHSKDKSYNKNVKKKINKMKKFTFDLYQVEEDLKYIYQRNEWEKEVEEMELNNKISVRIN